MIISRNPVNGEILATFSEEKSLEQRIEDAHFAFLHWKNVPVSERAEKFLRLAKIFREKKEELALLITLEIGRILPESRAEVEKCAWTCEYYAEIAEKFLQPEMVKTDASESYVLTDPLGVLLAVMPWNFPYWQIVRFAVPSMMVGNTILLKHASNVPQCALAIEKIFLEAGFPQNTFQTLLVGSSSVAKIIENPLVQGISLTGSEEAGKKVAEIAGKNLKKTVLELGGNNPFLICDDANMDLVITQGMFGRFQNCGQSCLAAKRFLVTKKNAEIFLEKFKNAVDAHVVGNPLEEGVNMGPMVSEKALQELDDQVKKSLEMGAKLIAGGKKLTGGIFDSGSFYAPTIISEVKKGMSLYSEEAFGPVASIMICENEEEMIAIANDSDFALGASVFTENRETAKKIIPLLHTPGVFVNGFVKSDPRLPFGGLKKSGYGRELSPLAFKEFANVKTVWMR